MIPPSADRRRWRYVVVECSDPFYLEASYPEHEVPIVLARLRARGVRVAYVADVAVAL